MIDWKPLNEDTIQTIKRTISMAPTCLNLGKKVGDIVHLLARPTGGTAPYIVNFKKGDVQLKQITNVSEGQIVTYDYTLVDVDTNATHVFSSEITDSCAQGAKSSIESCNITVSAVAPITCGIPVCNLVVS